MRPKDCTVFLTLLNFLRANKLKFRCLVLQVGFVDFTPKKRAVINDILRQRQGHFKNGFPVEKLGKYRLSSKKKEYLYSIDFDRPGFKREIVRTVMEYSGCTVFVGALEVDPKIRLERARPPEFYGKLADSNKFLEDLCKMGRRIYYIAPICDSRIRSGRYTYDGVHCTELGHRKVYGAVKDMIERLMHAEGQVYL
jgi:hypothetical protein